MKIACFYLPSFPLQVEWERHPVLRGRPVIVVFSPGPSQQEVLDFTPGMAGLQAGMPLQEALSCSQGALLVEADMPCYYEAFERVLKALENCGPSVEGAELGCAYMDLTGLEKLYGGEEGLKKALLHAIPPPFTARVGIGRGKFPARAVLSVGSRQSAVRGGESSNLESSNLRIREQSAVGDQALTSTSSLPTSEFLRECEVDILPVSWKTKQRLHSFGLHTLGHLAALSPGPLQAQFGPEGKQMWDLARGIDNRPLIPRRSEETVSVYLSFPEATASIGVIFLAVESLLRQAFARRELRDRYARGGILQSQVVGSAAWERRITFREPVGDKKRVLFIIKSAMNGVALPGPLEDLRLTFFGLTGEVGRQESFFSDVRQREQLGKALRQLETRLGKPPPVYQVRSLEPWSKIPERRQALVRFSP